MRVLMWMVNFWPNIGGVEVHATKFLPALQNRGYHFLVIASQSDPELPDQDIFKGIPVHRFPFHLANNNLTDLMKIRKDIAQLKISFRPDLIHRNGVGVGDFFNLTTANAYPAPLLVTLRGHWQKELDGLVAQTLRAANWVVGCSQAILEKGLALEPRIRTNSTTILNAFEEPDLPPSPLSFNPIRLLCLGRFHPVKGFDVGLTAFASLVHDFPEIRLVMAGDGPDRQKLEEQSEKLSLGNFVDFIGWIPPDQVYALINSVSMVFMPSRSESFPIVAIQAAQMARPVVGTRVGGMQEIVQDRETGLLVEAENSQEMSIAIRYLLEHPQTAIRFGQQAYLRVRESFGWEQHIQAYDRLYQKLIHSRRA